MRLRLTALLVAVALLGAIPAVSATGAGSTLPRHAVARLLAKSSLNAAEYGKVGAPCRTCLSSPSYPYSDWATPDPYQLGTDPEGRLVVVSTVKPNVIKVTRFDPVTAAQDSPRKVSFSGRHFSLVTAYLAPTGDIYALLARNAANTAQSGTYIVGKVVRFDSALTRLGTTKIPSDVTASAMDTVGVYQLAPVGESSMLLRDGALVVHTSRSIYADPGSTVHHEVDLTFAIDPATMGLVPTSGDFRWVSHSFNQLTADAGHRLVLVDHGDAYPRAISVSVVRNYFPTHTIGSLHNIDVLPFGGSIADNFTGATVNSLQTGAGRVLIAGISQPQQHPVDGITGSGSTTGYSPNVFLTSTRMSDGSTRFHWLTGFNPTGSVWVGQPAIVQLSNRRFAVLFTVARRKSQVMRYDLVNARGKVLVHKRWRKFGFAALSDPELVGGRIFWVGFHAKRGATTGGHLLYALDVTDPASPVFVN